MESESDRVIGKDAGRAGGGDCSRRIRTCRQTGSQTDRQRRTFKRYTRPNVRRRSRSGVGPRKKDDE